MDRSKPVWPQPYTKTHSQLRNAESGRDSLPQERTHGLVVQYQTVSPESTHRSNITQSRLYLGIFIYTPTYMHVTATNEKKVMN